MGGMELVSGSAAGGGEERIDLEVATMAVIVDALDPMPADVQTRILAYLTSRYGPAGNGRA